MELSDHGNRIKIVEVNGISPTQESLAKFLQDKMYSGIHGSVHLVVEMQVGHYNEFKLRNEEMEKCPEKNI